MERRYGPAHALFGVCAGGEKVGRFGGILKARPKKKTLLWVLLPLPYDASALFIFIMMATAN